MRIRTDAPSYFSSRAPVELEGIKHRICRRRRLSAGGKVAALKLHAGDLEICYVCPSRQPLCTVNLVWTKMYLFFFEKVSRICTSES